MAQVSLYLRVRMADGSQQYLKPVWLNKKELKALWAFVDGKPTDCPNGVYHLRYKVQGKRKWQKVGVSATTALAARENREWQLNNTDLSINAHLAPAPPPTPKVTRKTVAESIKVYLEDVNATKSDKTISGYTADLRRFTTSCTKTYVDEITAEDLQEFVRYLRAEGLGKRSVYNVFQSVNTWLRVAGISGPGTGGTPILKKLGQEYDEKVVDAYTQDEITALFAECDEDERLVYRFFLCSGCREQEVSHTEWADLNFADNTLHIQPKPHRNWKVKDREDRYVPLPADLMAELKERKGSAGRQDLVFPNSNGDPEGHFLRKLQDIAKNAGLEGKFELHKFRKTFATWHADAGVSVRTIQDWLGHSSLEVTQQYLKGCSAKSVVAQQAANRTFSVVSAAGFPNVMKSQTEAVQ